MIKHKEIWSAALKYADEHPSDYTNEMYDIVDIGKAFKAGVEWADKTAWKPSGEQMVALHDMNLTGNISYAGQGQTLIELYNDLKKL